MPETLNTLYIYIYIWTNLINKSNVGAAYHAAQIKKAYSSRKGLFVEEKIFLASNRVRDE